VEDCSVHAINGLFINHVAEVIGALMAVSEVDNVV